MKTQALLPTRPVSTRIEAGATHAIHVDADSYLQVRSGTVMLHQAPLWSTDPLQPAPQRLGDDHGHLATQAGWLYLKALSPTELVLHAPAPADQPWQALRTWIGSQARALRTFTQQRLRDMRRQRNGLRA